MPDLKGRWALVTGADGGIGSQFCFRLAERGCNIVALSIVEEGLDRLASELESRYSVKVMKILVDLTAPDALKALCERLDAEGVEPMVVINNAGVFSFNEVCRTSERRVGLFVDLHVRSVTELTREFACRMKERGEGYILNMSSMSCWMPMPGIALYSATKAYIRVLTRAMHYELKDSGVKLCVACPGGIATTLFGLPPKLLKLAVALGVVATPERFTDKALKRLLKGKKQYINGLLNRIAIVFVASMPTPIRMLIKHKMLDKGITVN